MQIERNPAMIADADDTLDAIATVASAPPRVEREPLREPVRAEDPRERARRRAAELKGVVEEMGDGDDKFSFDRKIIPDGWEYEWKRMTTYGARDPSYEVNLAQTGWEPVPLERHPEMMPRGWAGQTIERDGMMLMERPREISDMVRAKDRKRARLQLHDKEEQLGMAPKDHFDRDNKGTPMASVSKGYSPAEIPGDDED